MYGSSSFLTIQMISGTSKLVRIPRRCESSAIERASLLISVGELGSVFAGLLSGVGVLGCSIEDY